MPESQLLEWSLDNVECKPIETCYWFSLGRREWPPISAQSISKRRISSSSRTSMVWSEWLARATPRARSSDSWYDFQKYWCAHTCGSVVLSDAFVGSGPLRNIEYACVSMLPYLHGTADTLHTFSVPLHCVYRTVFSVRHLGIACSTNSSLPWVYGTPETKCIVFCCMHTFYISSGRFISFLCLIRQSN